MIDSFQRALAVTVAVTAVFVLTVFAEGGLAGDQLATGLPLLALNTLPLLALHRQPLAVVLVFCLAYPSWLDAGHPSHMFQSLPTLVALYAAGAWSRPLWLRAVALIAPVWMLVAVLIDWWPDARLHEIGYIAVIFGLGWLSGVVVAGRRSYVQQLEERTAALQAAQRELAEQAVADERARIARELHDIVAHAMSLITVRAGVGAHLVDARPAEAAEALRVIEHTGREALTEMRRMLAVLRDPDPHGPRSQPQPGLGDLPQLVAHAAAAGVPAALTVEGTPAPLPTGLELAAYRVIQEALTNVVKHTPGARASVRIRHRTSALEIEVDSTAVVAEPVEPGQGLRGMAERVALYDVQFAAGPHKGGFRVAARLPIPPPEPEPQPPGQEPEPQSAGQEPEPQPEGQL